MSRQQKYKQRKSDKGRFIPMYCSLFNSEHYYSLSLAARAILHGIMMQYNGKNNGNLCATSTMAKAWGVKSRATLIKSLKELEDKRFLIRTRQGVFMSSKTSCTLFALSWEELNEIHTINFDDQVKANLKFKQIIES